MTKILATLDGSPVSLAVLPVLAKLASDLKAHVTLFLVVEPVSATPTASRGISEVTAGGAAGAATGATMRAEAILRPDEPRWAESKGQAIQRVEAEGRDFLAGVAHQLREKGIEVDEQVVMGEEPAAAIIAFARRADVDIIAMATHGRSGLREVVQGSVAAEVVRSGVAPVLLVRPKP